MNLQEIARLAKVSKSTVSRVVNNDPNVSDRTREKVKAVIEEQGYVPNQAARSLVTSRSQTIGIVVPNHIGIFFDTSNYFPTILRGIAQGASDRDYAMLLMIGQDDEDDMRFTRRIVRNHMMDGVVLISPPIDHPLIDELVDSNTIFISADRIVRADVDVNFITVENVESSRMAVNHLIQTGCRRIVNLAGLTNIIDSRDRIEGYKLALQDAGIAFDPDLLKIVPYEHDAAYAATQELLTSGIQFDGMYANQSDIALGAVNALLDNNVRLPEDVALIGFDDLAESVSSRIGISTIRHPVLEKGQQLAHSLIDLIEETVTPPVQRFLSTELVVRDTCGG